MQVPSFCSTVALAFLLGPNPRVWQQSATHPAPAPSTTAAVALPPAPLGCAVSLRDQADPGACLQASSVPMPGLLFPPPHDGGVNNAAGGANSFIGGGSSNTTTGGHATIGGGLLNSADGASVVGGGTFNQAEGGSTIAGGRANFGSDSASIGGGANNSTSGGPFATIAGGYFNLTSGSFPSIGGGYMNFSQSLGAVGGGQYNAAEEQGVVGGGLLNFAGYQSAVGGGANNEAIGVHTAIPGGQSNLAFGAYSFAAGRRAKADHAGSFVWGDSHDADKPSSAANQFNVYASGGARLFSDAAATNGVLLAPGGGSWSSVSDRAAKENLVPIDAADVLARVRELPIATWNYRTQDDSVRHMGPVAQDFRALFGLGASETAIDTIDPDGVALAAIQGLCRLVDEQAGRIATLEARLAALERPAAR